jgi:nucleotidyltransferase/DNA polymerase involved in DNA repair
MKQEIREILQELQKIPGVGKRVSQDLYDLNIRSIADLKDKDPEELYFELCEKRGVQIDRCMLYVLRGAVYFAETPNPDPEKLKWWNWKDKK